jgi:predicted amidophosphoribosyltransferase
MIPNNINRAQSLNQLIKEKLAYIYPNLPRIDISKTQSPRNLPQKSLRGVDQRIQNATRLFNLTDGQEIVRDAHILLIDDVF